MCIARVEVVTLTNSGSETKTYNTNLNDADVWGDIKVLFMDENFTGYITVPGIGFKKAIGGQYADQ